MKKFPLDLDDSFFRHQFKIPTYSVSLEDKDLFLKQVEKIPHKNSKELKYNPIRISSQFPHIDSFVATDRSNEIEDSSRELFQYWIQNKLGKNLSLSHKDTIPRKGQQRKCPDPIPVLDLHGFSRAEALEELKSFLSRLPQGTKKARIIHGKGLSRGQPSIIRQEVREWLYIQKKQASWITDFCYENAQNGGHGATLIWIKKGEYYGKY